MKTRHRILAIPSTKGLAMVGQTDINLGVLLDLVRSMSKPWVKAQVKSKLVNSSRLAQTFAKPRRLMRGS